MMSRYLIIFFMTMSAVTAWGLVDEPKGCWKAQRFPCALKTATHAERINWNDSQVVIGVQSMAVIHPKEIRILKGAAWVNSEQDVLFVTSYLSVRFRGEIWISHGDDQTQVKNLNGEVLSLTGRNGVSDVLPTGFENWYSALNSKGDWARGVIRPIILTQFLPMWVAQMNIHSKEAAAQVAKWKTAWNSNIETSAEAYQYAVRRDLAHIENEKRQAAQRRQQLEQERQDLLRLFRSKNGLPE